MSLENSVNSSKGRVKKPDKNLVSCDWKECKQRGEYIYCYFNINENCDIYQRHLNNLKKG